MNKEIMNLVNYYCDTLLLGYTEENWTRASRYLQQLSGLIDLKSYTILGDLMSEMYAEPISKKVTTAKKFITKQLQQMSS